MADEFLEALGISASTGRPLSAFGDETVQAMLKGANPKAELEQMRSKVNDATSFALSGDFRPDKLDETGWGVVYAPGVDQKIKDALQPLIDHRRQSANPFKIYDGDLSPSPGITAEQWLQDRGVRLDVVDPDKGVPYYLLLVGSPESLPFEFQYTLDLHWAVGRLWFDTPEEFRQYADSVVQYEKAAAIPTERKIAMFATEHEFDQATQLFMANVVTSMMNGEGTTPVPLGKRQRFTLDTCLGDKATKSGLHDLLNGRSPAGRPSVLFSGSHGMQFEEGDARQTACQGAIVCHDWEGYGAITENHWFAANDVPAGAKVHGLVHLFFACHGGGCTTVDDFDVFNGEPRRMAAQPFLSKLPQRLLSHPNGGALAVIAHVERAWAYSFLGKDRSAQSQGFRSVLAHVMRGDTVGFSTEDFNMRWATESINLASQHLKLQKGEDIPLKALGKMWVARNDARNFVILGDPAVRIQTEKFTD